MNATRSGRSIRRTRSATNIRHPFRMPTTVTGLAVVSAHDLGGHLVEPLVDRLGGDQHVHRRLRWGCIVSSSQVRKFQVPRSPACPNPRIDRTSCPGRMTPALGTWTSKPRTWNRDHGQTTRPHPRHRHRIDLLGRRLPTEGQTNDIIEIGLCPLEVSTGRRLEKRSILVRPERSRGQPVLHRADHAHPGAGGRRHRLQGRVPDSRRRVSVGASGSGPVSATTTAGSSRSSAATRACATRSARAI